MNDAILTDFRLFFDPISRGNSKLGGEKMEWKISLDEKSIHGFDQSQLINTAPRYINKRDEGRLITIISFFAPILIKLISNFSSSLNEEVYYPRNS